MGKTQGLGRILSRHRRRKHGIADMATGKVAADGQLIDLLGTQMVVAAEMALPQGAALLGRGQWQVDDLIQPAGKGGVKAFSAVAGQEDDAAIELDAL